ncbi:hypothetical protein RIF29_24723 [Crotalaria pallida]|uniref:Uncharacterized protein n=1 Tax=Crotalaria pallida TaxID=3830 RepID=A0AAN9EQF0_CROPI
MALAFDIKLQSRLEQEEEAKAALLGRIQRLTKLILVSIKASHSTRFPNRPGPHRIHSFGEEEMRKMRSCIDEKLYRTLHTIVHNHTLQVAEARIGMRENFRCSASSMGVQSQLSTLSQIMKTVDPSICTSLVVRGSESLYHPSMHVIRRMIETVLLWPCLNSDSFSKAQHGCIDCLTLMICAELQAEEDSIPKITSVVRKKGNSVVSYVIYQFFNEKESTSTPELGDESVVAVPLSFRVCMGDVLISACQKISESCKKQFAEQVLPSVLHSVKE